MLGLLEGCSRNIVCQHGALEMCSRCVTFFFELFHSELLSYSVLLYERNSEWNNGNDSTLGCRELFRAELPWLASG